MTKRTRRKKRRERITKKIDFFLRILLEFFILQINIDKIIWIRPTLITHLMNF